MDLGIYYAHKQEVIDYYNLKVITTLFREINMYYPSFNTDKLTMSSIKLYNMLNDAHFSTRATNISTLRQSYVVPLYDTMDDAIKALRVLMEYLIKRNYDD